MKRKLNFKEFLAEQQQAEKTARRHQDASKHLIDEDSRDQFEERAAILEFCAGLSRQGAEELAHEIVTQYIAERHKRGPVAGQVAGSQDNLPPLEPA
uniref:Uncharacterized protein n=1 Tax=mine drainage metagenome TaxID=410659 RepID=E6PNL1_9ZZZZ